MDSAPVLAGAVIPWAGDLHAWAGWGLDEAAVPCLEGGRCLPVQIAGRGAPVRGVAGDEVVAALRPDLTSWPGRRAAIQSAGDLPQRPATPVE